MRVCACGWAGESGVLSWPTNLDQPTSVLVPSFKFSMYFDPSNLVTVGCTLLRVTSFDMIAANIL